MVALFQSIGAGHKIAITNITAQNTVYNHGVLLILWSIVLVGKLIVKSSILKPHLVTMRPTYNGLHFVRRS